MLAGAECYFLFFPLSNLYHPATGFSGTLQPPSPCGPASSPIKFFPRTDSFIPCAIFVNKSGAL